MIRRLIDSIGRFTNRIVDLPIRNYPTILGSPILTIRNVSYLAATATGVSQGRPVRPKCP